MTTVGTRHCLHRSLRRRTLLFVGAALVTCAQPGAAAWHDDHPGSDLTVHYVRLAGRGNVDFEQKLLLDTYRICALTKRVRGEEPPPFSQADVPASPLTKDVEIYYGVEQTASVTTVNKHVIDMATCRLTMKLTRNATVNWANGHCDIDLVKKRAFGACKTSTFAGLPTTRPHRVAPADQQTEFRTIAGLSCRVHAHPIGPTEYCIAQPMSPAGALVEPVALRLSPHNGNFAGLSLEVSTAWETLQAQEVRLALPVSAELFSLPPPGTVVNPNARP